MTQRSDGEGGERLGRYVLEARIARGGMGEVFRASAVGADDFRKPVVIKRVLAHAATKELSDMFVAEAKLMTRLAHPNIVEVFDFGKADDGAYFLVMELVNGLDLRAFSEGYRKTSEPMPIPLALYIAREALRGLSFAHTQALGREKLVHRDVSPGNILLSTLGEVKVADFGVALVSAPDAAAGDSLIVGKPSYMAPEQANGDTIDARADLFSLGVVLHELVAGKLPFSEDAFNRCRSGASAAPRDLRADRDDAHPALAALLQKALAERPVERYADARDMLRALDALRSEGLLPASADELAEAVSERARTREPEQVIVIGRDIAGERTRVERGESGTAFTLSVDEPEREPTHHTERLAAESSESGPAASPSAAPKRWSRVLGVTLGGLTLCVAGALLFAFRFELTRAPSTLADASATATGASVAASATTASAIASVTPPALPTHSASAVFSAAPRLLGSLPLVSPPAPPAPSSATCSGTVKLMASHGWAVRGGPSAVEAPGVYSWRCGSYNLSATSRLDDQKRAASVVVREDKQAVVDLR